MKILVCISGASFAGLGLDLLRNLSNTNHEIYAIISQNAKIVLQKEENIKFDKITVWDGGTGSANGSTTANFMKDLIKALPAMHDLAGQAGIELPQILGKVDSGSEEEKAAASAKPVGKDKK